MEGITATPAALAHFQAAIAKGHSSGIRVAIKTTGCSGLTYVVETVGEVKPNDHVFTLDDKVRVYIDPLSYPLVRGLLVDYATEGFNKSLRFTNPNASGTCGCGESFTVEKVDDKL